MQNYHSSYVNSDIKTGYMVQFHKTAHTFILLSNKIGLSLPLFFYFILLPNYITWIKCDMSTCNNDQI